LGYFHPWLLQNCHNIGVHISVLGLSIPPTFSEYIT
jgi:hypothetical protein